MRSLDASVRVRGVRRAPPEVPKQFSDFSHFLKGDLQPPLHKSVTHTHAARATLIHMCYFTAALHQHRHSRATPTPSQPERRPWACAVRRAGPQTISPQPQFTALIACMRAALTRNRCNRSNRQRKFQPAASVLPAVAMATTSCCLSVAADY